jgi:hypothetical protein
MFEDSYRIWKLYQVKVREEAEGGKERVLGGGGGGGGRWKGKKGGWREKRWESGMEGKREGRGEEMREGEGEVESGRESWVQPLNIDILLSLVLYQQIWTN